MENRDRDKMSKSTGSTEAGKINRDSSRQSGSDVSFDKGIGRSEDLEKEPSRKGDSDMSSSSGRSSGSSEH